MEVWRYPVKSMGGERLDACLISDRGLESDRRWALVDGVANRAGKLLSIRQDERLMTYSARLADHVALGLRFLGALLMGSLMIIPPATARRLARNLASMLAISVAVALIATLFGGWLATRFDQESGPMIVSVASVCFFLSLASRRAPGA